ncbi:MAG: hypothetical protein A2941_01715 [Candidatus Yanofskybacteria bacterium RIFCSPLOWO2_01_FULL_49_17]|uniref:DUF8128 domain-containing protein n=1 Tax=Candidatus Yanofskybacteria bacterium RIFCSPLOWO2_01_FULL_49_17 TaxID=1802700 RepID=A0A1F8GQL3_9BACT|nr:MAG: hypothetical protein A2941_01715 [Candidatus Yanofskybacteria bacterium RIFCSPLOWO2_01_FULL_49_17]
MELLITLFSALAKTFGLLFFYWWLWLPWALLAAFWESLTDYAQRKYISELKWVLLEIKIPRDTHKSPRGMEQVFAALHTVGFVPPAKKLIDKWLQWKWRNIDGKVSEWVSFEMLGLNGEIHFYVRTLEARVPLVQSQIYAHYPEAELSQVPDYVSQLPAVLPNDEYELDGMELGLEKDDVFPIRTYVEFDEPGGGKEDIKRIDPLASLTEVLNHLQLGEYLAVQYLFRYTDAKWIEKAKEHLDKFTEQPQKPRNDTLDKLMSGIETGVSSIFGGGQQKEEKKEEKKEGKKFMDLSPGTQDVIKAMERSFTKLGFQTGIRLIYTAPKDRFVKERSIAAFSAFRLFSTQTLNGFKPAFMPTVFRGRRKAERTVINKRWLYQRFRFRAFPEKPFTLTTEELATVFHFPDISVHTPTLPRIEAKKGEAPTNIPIV